MDKPPKGKHSTKGLGKTIPQESDYVKWRDEVVVPCGKPVPSKVKASELLYNEYIVYDIAQASIPICYTYFCMLVNLRSYIDTHPRFNTHIEIHSCRL